MLNFSVHELIKSWTKVDKEETFRLVHEHINVWHLQIMEYLLQIMQQAHVELFLVT